MDKSGEKGIPLKDQLWYGKALRWAPAALVLFFIYQAVLSDRLDSWVHQETFQYSKTQRMDAKVSSTLRAAAFLCGYRVLVGHVFWIKVIQYYGDVENSVDRYIKLYDYCSLASDLNPQFVSIYTYGATALAFHLHRIDEATMLLEKGIRSNPRADRLKYLLAAIGYQHTERYDLIIPVLEEEANRPDAPPILVNILANTYKKVGRYNDAIKLWKKILTNAQTNDLKIEAARKLQELYGMKPNNGTNP